MALHIWANTGEDKICQEETRLLDGRDTRNSIWNGSEVRLWGLGGEVVSFCLILEADTLEQQVTVIPSSADVEVYFVRYLQIKGCSTLSYEHYDERHVPERLRRPHNQHAGSGGWSDRFLADKHVPDIAAPLGQHYGFTVEPGRSQCLWVDLLLPTTVIGAARYAINVNGHDIPILVDVKNGVLPSRKVRAFAYASTENINRRYFNEPYIDPGQPRYAESIRVHDAYHRLARQHGINLIQEHVNEGRLDTEWAHRFSGELFDEAAGYRGRHESVGSDVYSIGTYGTWPWKSDGVRGMRQNTDLFEDWFKEHAPHVWRWLYLADESPEWKELNRWSNWVHNNPGSGRYLPTMATLTTWDVLRRALGIDIVAVPVRTMDTRQWKPFMDKYQARREGDLVVYNGWRPASPTFTTEDDGVSLRVLAWIQFKFGIRRWFKWESTYYQNYQSGQETDVFNQAYVFGTKYGGRHESLGETGDNYNNGDGVLMFPGTDRVFPQSSYNQLEPIASLRLKHWRRGLQDLEYLHLAAAKNYPKTMALVDRMVPKALWELGVTDRSDPTWVLADISWSTDADHWEAARSELWDIMRGA